MTLQNKKLKESGNVFIIILAGIALFAALVFTFTSSSKKGTGNLSKQQAKIAAQEILSYSRLVEQAVDRVRRNGCSENEISFENDTVTGYENTNAPTDNSCHIFENEGGRLEWQNVVTNYLDPSRSSEVAYNEWRYTGRSVFVGQGSINTDLILYLGWLQRSICIELNNLLEIENPLNTPPIEPQGFANTEFIGSFVGSGAFDLSGTTKPNTPSGCFESEARTGFHFVHLLLAR